MFVQVEKTKICSKVCQIDVVVEIFVPNSCSSLKKENRRHINDCTKPKNKKLSKSSRRRNRYVGIFSCLVEEYLPFVPNYVSSQLTSFKCFGSIV